MAKNPKVDVTFEDGASGESLDLMLRDGDGVLGFQRRLMNPYAAKMGAGNTKYADLTEWSVWSQMDWRGGRGQEDAEDEDAWFDSWNVETRIDGQLTLGPLPIGPLTDSYPAYTPGSVTGYAVGWLEPPRYLGRATGLEARRVVTVAGYSGSKHAQLFYVWPHYGAAHLVESVKVKVRKKGSPTEPLKVAVYDDDDGEPGTELASAEIDAGDIGSSWAWETGTLDTAYELTGYGYHWVVVSTAAADTENCYEWALDPGPRPYWQTLMLNYELEWEAQAGTYTFQVDYATFSRSQSFTTPVGGLTCQEVWLPLWGSDFLYGSAGLTVKLCQDNAGDPGTVLQTKTVLLPPQTFQYLWTKVQWDSSEELDGDTMYHIVVEPPGSAWYAAVWGGNPSGGYSGGASKEKVGNGTWTAQTEDLYFRVNAPELDAAPLAFARYSGSWYCAAGDTVYVWDDDNCEWDASEQVVGDILTDLEVWGGYLWAARGNDANIRKYDGNSWADGGKKGTYLKGGGGYLHLSGAGSDDYKVYYTVDGTEWSAAIPVGVGDYAITGMVWFRDALQVATATKLYRIAAEIAYMVLDWSSQEDESNGKNMMVWMRTGALYLPLRFGLYRWNGDTMVAVGPEQGTGLPGGRAGKVAALVGTNNWLFAAIDAEDSGRSSVLAYNGMGGWHEIARAEEDGQRIRALGFETVHSPSRLWYGLGVETRYMQLPDTSDNPYAWTGFEFNATGEWESSWIGGDLLEVIKDLHEVILRGDGFDSGQTVDVYYEVDRSGRWTYLGRVEAGPRTALQFDASIFVSKETGSGCTRMTIEVGSGSTEDLNAGDWVRIKHANGEEAVAQIATIMDSDTFTLETALDRIPGSGAAIYGSRPAGREFRFKLVLGTTDNTATPRVLALACRYQANVLDRFVFQLQVPIIEGMEELDGTRLGWAAKDLRLELDRWAKRVTPFSLYDPDGNEWRVKVVSAGESGYNPVQHEGGKTVYRSNYSLSLIEV